jgi:hypothetical protein
MLERIEEKIAAKLSSLDKPTGFKATKALTRHEMDLERAITHGKKANSICLVTAAKPSTSHKYPDPNHPMNKIA